MRYPDRINEGPLAKENRMALKLSVMQPVPAETARVAQAAFPKGHPYLTLRDELGPIFADSAAI